MVLTHIPHKEQHFALLQMVVQTKARSKIDFLLLEAAAAGSSEYRRVACFNLDGGRSNEDKRDATAATEILRSNWPVGRFTII